MLNIPINNCLEKGIYLDEVKITYVSPIFKKVILDNEN